MSRHQNPSQPTGLLGEITPLLMRSDRERYTFSDAAVGRIERLVEAATKAPDSVRSIGDLLKLVHVLRSQYESPAAAEAIVDVLRRSPAAMRIVALNWSSGAARPRFGADLAPLPPAQAPHVERRESTADGVKVSAFLTPGRDSPEAYLGRKTDRTKT